MNAKDIFLRATEIDSPEERRAFMDRECDGDDQLRRRVEALLAAHDDPDSYLDRPAAKFDVAETTDGSGLGLSDSSSHHGRFLPGTRVADRYRIVSMLGRGGMGEVYRADDLRLGQSVALKFLPPELASDKKRLGYFHNEVRLTRQISHPNVCRVYDIGVVEGHHFISMEYIDGEDLKVLLHRIGRLPNHKGIEIARQLCAGLAAAHARGVLHRDLKPANIMVDGQGQVRITDFGLAAAAEDGENTVGMSGTPAYMAPEQLLRGETSVQSDIYSLGLILFEVFTGEPAYTGNTLAELRQLHQESASTTGPSDRIDEIDISVGRAIRSCLQPDSADRPSSVASLAQAFPGGDPLAAAIAAGETPSPELVAAAADTGVLTRNVATSYLAATLVLFAIAVFIIPRTSHVQAIGAKEWSPDVLRHRAREILRHLGVDEQPHSCHGFANRTKELHSIDKHVTQSELSIRDRLHRGPYHGLEYWYRESSRHFFVNELWRGFGDSWNRANETVPHWTVANMNGVHLSPTGRLRWFRVIPANEVVEVSANAEPAWDEWFSESITGIDLGALERVGWQGRPPDAYDRYQAWEGNWPDTDLPLRVHAASFRGRPVFFQVMPPEAKSSTTGEGFPILGWVVIAYWFLCPALAMFHYFSGRGDRRGAHRFALYIAVATFMANMLLATHIPARAATMLTSFALTRSAGNALTAWCLYMAIEPIARRHWPNLLVSWTRLLRGAFRDPQVGRDLLVGTLVGVGMAIVVRINSWYLGSMPLDSEETLVGVPSLLGFIVRTHIFEINSGFVRVLFLVCFAFVLRSQRLAPFGIFCVSMLLWGTENPVASLPGQALVIAFGIWLLVHYGVLCSIVAASIAGLLAGVITFDTDAFYFSHGITLLATVLASSVYGYVVSLGFHGVRVGHLHFARARR